MSVTGMYALVPIVPRWIWWAHQKAILEAPRTLKTMVLGTASNPQSISSSALVTYQRLSEIVLRKHTVYFYFYFIVYLILTATSS